MTPGGQTVTFVTVTAGTPDRLGVAALTRTGVPVAGCLMTPVTAAETVDATDVSDQVWTCVAPTTPTTLAASAVDELDYEGVTYQITGVRHRYDQDGDVDHVTVTCRRRDV